MADASPATRQLHSSAVSFDLAHYDYDPDAARIGMQAAEALGEAPQRVLKTLIAQADGKPVCVILPANAEVNLRKLAAVIGAKSASMTKPQDAERITGYKVGGVSPFGQKRKLPTVIEQSALAEDYVYVNGGRRGLQIRLNPQDIIRVLNAISAPIIA